MSQNVLWLHHFHEYWSSGLEKEGTNFENEMSKVMDFVKHNDLDRIIITMYEENKLQPEHSQLVEYCQNNGIEIDSYEYNYAWYRDEDSAEEIYQEEKFGKTWIYGTRDYHDGDCDVLEIEEWQHALKNNEDKVILGGAFARECLDDANTVLKHLEVDYEENQALCVGYGVEYKYIGESPDSLYSKYQEKIDEIEVKIQLFTMNNDCDDDFESIMEVDREFLKSISKEINDVFEDEEDMETFNLNNMWFSSCYEYVEAQLDDIMAYERTSEILIDRIEEWEEENPEIEEIQKNRKKFKM